MRILLHPATANETKTIQNILWSCGPEIAEDRNRPKGRNINWETVINSTQFKNASGPNDVVGDVYGSAPKTIDAATDSAATTIFEPGKRRVMLSSLRPE